MNISLIAYKEDDDSLLEERVTAERITELFASVITRPVERYCIPGLGALNFILHRPASESVTRSLALDAHGMTFCFVLLRMEI